MTKLQESGLYFQFDENWYIKKYDATPYYLAMSGLGMSAVDFVGFWKGQVFLIEVKNYKNRPKDQLAFNRAKLEGTSPPLMATFAEKTEETLQGIAVIHKALARRWWYALIQKTLPYSLFRPYLLRSERLFWLYVDSYIQVNQDKIQLILWLELPETLEHLRPNFSKKLKANFSQVSIWNTENVAAFGISCKPKPQLK